MCKREDDMRIAVVDFETSGFQGDFNDLLVAGIKDLHKDEFIMLRIDEFNRKHGIWTDEALIRTLISTLRFYHVIIGHNFKNFDVKFLRGRCLGYGIDPIDSGTLCFDTYLDLRSYARISRYKLEAFAQSLGINAVEVARSLNIDPQVIEINPTVWKKAQQLDKQSLDFITDHCKVDLAVNEQAYWKYIDVRKIRGLRRLW